MFELLSLKKSIEMRGQGVNTKHEMKSLGYEVWRLKSDLGLHFALKMVK